MATPVYAFSSGLADRVALLAIKCLAVAGAFLFGYFLGAAIVWGIDKWVLAKKTPDTIKKICKTLIGVIVAIIVALIVFGEGGNGLFGGGGGGEGKGTPNSESSSEQGKHSQQATRDGNVQSSPLPKPPEAKSADLIIQVIIYGGSKVLDDRFYQIDGDQMLMSLKELQGAINTRKSKEKGKVAIAIRLASDQNSASGDPRAINMVIDWAREQGLDVTLPANR
jgi:hypothetical protein